MNFKMKIILTEQSTLATNGSSINTGLTSAYQFFEITKDLSKINSCTLLIKHGTLTGYTHNNSHWFIETGGSKRDVPPTDKVNAGQISWNTFTENIENFLKQVKDKTEITKEDIEVLYAIDPKLEELLKPFATLSPFATKLPNAKDSNGNEIKKDDKTLNIKEVLTDYVKDKIAKQ